MDNYVIKEMFIKHPSKTDDHIARELKLTSSYVKAIRERLTPQERVEIMEKLKFNNTCRAYAGGNGAAIVRED
jgi:hypothetical protein